MASSAEGDNVADLDETKLTGDEAEIYLLHWLSSTELDLKNGSSSTFKTSQSIYETKLLKVIAGQSPYPAPGRPFRQLASRCLVYLYTRGESRTLYDTLQTLLKSVAEVKNASPDVEYRKIAAMYCIGELMGSLGGQVMSLMGEVTSIALKQFRYTSNSVLLRYHALTTLKKGISTAGRALTDPMMKDILKQTRNALNDRAMPIQRAAADTLIVLYPSGDGNRSIQDVETIVSSALKSIEHADAETRRVLAHLVGHILASTQTPRLIPPPPNKATKSNKSFKPESENDAEDEPSAIATEQASKPILTTEEMLSVLSNAFNRSSISLNMRVGIFECYGLLFTTLGSGFVEREYKDIVRHIMQEIVSRSSSTEKVSREKENLSILILKLVDLVLNELVGVRMLSEQGQVNAILELSTSYLKKWPALLSSSAPSSRNTSSSRAEPEPLVLTSILRLTCGLLSQLGAAPPSVQDALSRPLQTLLEHPSKEVRVCAAYALRGFCYNAPRGIARTVSSILEGLQRDVSGLGMFQDGVNSAGGSNMPSEKELTARALGHAYGLSALFSIIPLRPLYVSSDLSSRVFDTATQLLRTAGKHNIRRAAVEVECAWIALASLMCLGPAFVRTQVTNLMVLWRNALPKPTSKDLNSTSTSFQSKGSGTVTVTTSDRNVSEWSFMLHVRACALGAVLEFLRWNGWKLATRDVQRRLVGLLGNALAFANAFIASHSSSPPPGGGGIESEHDLQLAFEREAILRRRVYECFSELASGYASCQSISSSAGTGGNGFLPLPESTQLALLQSTAAIFVGGYSELERGASALQTAIASVNTNFNSLWVGYRPGPTGSNGEAWGITSLVGFEEDGAREEGEEGDVGFLANQPILGSPELDPLLLCQSPIPLSSSPLSSAALSLFPSDSRISHNGKFDMAWCLPEPPSAQIAVVDASITLFSLLLPGQEKKECLKAISEVVDAARAISVSSPFSSPNASGVGSSSTNGTNVGMGKERNVGRKAAVLINAATAITGALRVATIGLTNSINDRRDSSVDLRETVGNKDVSERIASFLKETLISTDPVLRRLSAEALGRLASLSDTSFLTSLVKWLVDSVVSNRDPYARSGCARAFGALYTHVGGLALGPLLKTTVNVLMSLSNDPHPVVHYHSISALAEVVQSASLAYAGYVKGTLGTLVRLYSAETHDPEGGTLANVNLKSSWRVQRVICRVIDAVVAVLGPDIQEEEQSKTRILVLGLVRELGGEDVGVIVEAIKCMQHLLMFTASGQVNVDELLLKLRSHLSSPRRILRTVAINTLYQLVQRDALGLARSKSGGDALVEELFGMLDGAAGVDRGDNEDGGEEGGVREVIKAWMEKTGEMNPVAWIGLCQRIMTRSHTSTELQKASKVQSGALADDEGQSLSFGLDSSAGGDRDDTGSSNGGLSARWRTQLFALRCLHRICTIVAQSGRREHLDIPYVRALNSSLASKGPQTIREKELLVSHVADLIKMAFTASAAYVTEIRLAGLVLLKDVIEVFSKSPDSDFEDALLLEQYQAPITSALTPAFTADTTPEILASAVKVCAVFVGSGVVRDVVRMGRILKLLTSALEQSTESGMLSIGEAGELSPNASVMLRVATLEAWAELEVASTGQTYLEDVVKPYRQTLGSLWISALRDYASIKGDNEINQDSSNSGVEEPYMNLGREVLLPYYEKSWPVMLHAVSTAMKANDPYVLASMDGLDTVPASLRDTREEPTVLFFALFGLIYEALALSSADSTPSPTLRSNASIALEALESLVKPEYSGKALLDEPIFEEFRGMCIRIAMTEGATVCIKLVRVVRAFAESQKKNLLGSAQSPNTVLSNGPLSHCLRICAYVLRKSISGSGGMPSVNNESYAERISLIRTAFETFVLIGRIFGPSLKEDVRAVAVSLYAELLREEKEDVDIAGPTLSSLKTILDDPPLASDKDGLSRYSRLIHGLLSACLVNIDEMRGRLGNISTMKVNNNLLAAVLVLTVVPPRVGFSEEALEYCCSLISQKLLEKEAYMTAAHCAKTIIFSGTSGNSMLKFCIKLLLPGTIEYIAFVASLVNDPLRQEEQAKAVDEILKAYSAFFSSTPAEYRARILGVLLPTLALLLDPQQGQASTRSVHKLAIVQILALASLSPAAFKEATGKLESVAREKIELSVRQELEGKNKNSVSGSTKPQISLRSF